jgi:hypothetical protein
MTHDVITKEGRTLQIIHSLQRKTWSQRYVTGSENLFPSPMFLSLWLLLLLLFYSTANGFCPVAVVLQQDTPWPKSMSEL